MSEQAIDYTKLRLDGIYQQNQAGDLMLRIKIPAGVLSAEQAFVIATLCERFSNGLLHLTTRGSMELHGLHYPDLPTLFQQLAAVGLTSRGACGGAVRGISCSTTFAPTFNRVQPLLRRLHRHFAGNPHFEGLPKKFKIGVEADYQEARHLIQDVGLVQVGDECYDVWIAGGLGRQPRAGFLFERQVAEEQLIPLLEAIIHTYRQHTPPPKRLKHLAEQLGESRLRELIEQERSRHPQSLPFQSLEPALTADPEPVELTEFPVFAGELSSSLLRRLAVAVRDHGDGFLLLTANQNLACVDPQGLIRQTLATELPPADNRAERSCRICVGNQLCKMGLAPTRELARQVLDALNPTGQQLSWAISGCPNSCAQVQLADAGILVTQLSKDAAGNRQPRFSLLRRTGTDLGQTVAEDLNLQELLRAVAELK